MKHKSTKLNGSKYCNVSLTIQLNISHYKWLNNQTVLFQTIHFSTSHLFVLRLDVKQLYLTHRVDLGAMAMKGYAAFPKALALLEPCHQIV